MATDTLRWVGRWDSRRELSEEDYLKLTMAAIAKELFRRGVTQAPVYLAVNLPLNWAAMNRWRR